MGYMNLPLRRYFEFSGRSRRMEYWLFVLFTMIASVALHRVDEALGLRIATSDPSSRAGLLSSLFLLGTIIPGLAVAVRRLHDIDRSGLWVLMPLAVILALTASGSALFPGFGAASLTIGLGIVAFLALLVFFCREGTRGPNRFGADPKVGGRG